MTGAPDPVQPAPRVSDEPREWLIRKGAWFYRSDWCGYTSRKDEAGRYTEVEARKEAELEPWHMAAVHQDSVPNPPPTLYDVALARITALEAEKAELDRQRRLFAAHVVEVREENERLEAENARLREDMAKAKREAWIAGRDAAEKAADDWINSACRLAVDSPGDVIRSLTPPVEAQGGSDGL